MRLQSFPRSMLGFCLMAAMAACMPGCENNEPHIEPVNVAGIWNVVGIWTGASEVDFKQDGPTVTAFVAKKDMYWEFQGGMQGDLLQGSFTATTGAQPITISATVSGNNMRGTWVIFPDQGVFTATRK